MSYEVSDTGSNTEENIERAVKALGRSEPRRRVFEAIYFHKKQTKSVQEVTENSKLDRKVVLTHGKHLVGSGLVKQVKLDGDTAYQVISFYQHHKAKILRLVADPKKLEKLITKRNPAVIVENRPAKITKRQLSKQKKLTVLYLFANPDPDPDPDKYIRPDAEAKLVLEAIRGSKFRDHVNIEIRPAAGLKTIQDGLNDLAPEVVHFSGHSSSIGIAADTGAIGETATQFLSFELLGEAMDAVDTKPRVAVFNSCFSSAGRKKILNAVEIMIGMTDPISDHAATAFSTRFYAALASGMSVKSAFKQGVVAISAVALDEKETAELYEQDGIDSSELFLT